MANSLKLHVGKSQEINHILPQVYYHGYITTGILPRTSIYTMTESTMTPQEEVFTRQ